jgi:4-alpha-glucanotransferase
VNPHFSARRNLNPESVSGVPPDYFSEEGQLWGGPLYRWDRLEAEGFAWWIERIRANLRLYDLLRIDHFRGFAGYWAVPAGETTAKRGRWLPGPGMKLFRALRAALGEMPIVAEDLGEITPDVRELVREVGVPGMKVLQFAFSEGDSDHAPHGTRRTQIVYDARQRHDQGWCIACSGARPRARTSAATGARSSDSPRVASVADVATFDGTLGLGSEGA